jgi:hypothetical protein
MVVVVVVVELSGMNSTGAATTTTSSTAQHTDGDDSVVGAAVWKVVVVGVSVRWSHVIFEGTKCEGLEEKKKVPWHGSCSCYYYNNIVGSVDIVDVVDRRFWS